MASVNLLAAFGNDVDVETFAMTFFPAIGAENYEERESSNYIDGRYFKGVTGTTLATVSMAEEMDHSDLPVWVQFTDDALNEASLNEVVISIIQTKLLPSGFKCARMLNFGRGNEQRIDCLPSA